MNKESREHLSCFMDGEINQETSRFLVRRLGADSELRKTWTRYHLVRDCLRHPEGDMLGIGLCGRVQQAMANETPLPSKPGFTAAWSKEAWLRAGWFKPVAGMAIAASVAIMAIITVVPGQSTNSTPMGELAGTPQVESFISPNHALGPSPRSQPVSVLGGSGNSSHKIYPYLLRHHQVTGSMGGKGFVFVPVVATQSAARVEIAADPQGDQERLTEDGEDSQSGDALDGASESARQ